MVTKEEKTLTRKNQRVYNKTRKYLERIRDSQIEGKMKIIEYILKIKDKKIRYSKLYDLLCDYLDHEFQENNYCNFKNGICEKRRCLCQENPNEPLLKNGCCYSIRKKENCKYLTSTGCSIKNIACKLYTCDYLRKKKVKIRLNSIYLIRYTLNRRQKLYLSTTFFTPKEELIRGLIKRRWIYGIR